MAASFFSAILRGTYSGDSPEADLTIGSMRLITSSLLVLACALLVLAQQPPDVCLVTLNNHQYDLSALVRHGGY